MDTYTTETCVIDGCDRPRGVWAGTSSNLCSRHLRQRRDDPASLQIPEVCPHPDHYYQGARTSQDIYLDGQWWCTEHCPIRGQALVDLLSEGMSWPTGYLVVTDRPLAAGLLR